MAWQSSPLELRRMNQLLQRSRSPGVYCRWLATLQRLHQISTTTAATSQNEEKDPIEKLQNNPYFDKYKRKIKDLQQNAPEEFESRLEDFKKKKQPQKKESIQLKEKKEPMPVAASRMSQTSKESLTKLTKDKALNDIMKVDLLKNKSADDIKQIWQQYFAKKDYNVFAVIPGKIYKVIHDRSNKYPMFLYPLPRGDGYEFFVASFSGHDCYFTPLIAYQAHQADAPVCLTLHHYAELADEKGLVLMNGEYNRDVINVQDAQLLCQQVQMYYGPDSTCYHLVETFNSQPDDFEHTALITELEKLPLS